MLRSLADQALWRQSYTLLLEMRFRSMHCDGKEQHKTYLDLFGYTDILIYYTREGILLYKFFFFFQTIC